MLLIKNKACVDLKAENVTTALYLAASDVDTAELLLVNGSGVDGVKYNGSTTLMAACRNGRLDVTKLLINHRARIDLKTGNGSTALSISTQNLCRRQLIIHEVCVLDLNRTSFSMATRGSFLGNFG